MPPKSIDPQLINSNGGWIEYSQYVLKELERQSSAIDKTRDAVILQQQTFTKEINDLRIAFAEKLNEAVNDLSTKFSTCQTAMEDKVVNTEKDVLKLNFKTGAIISGLGFVGGIIASVAGNLILKAITSAM